MALIFPGQGAEYVGMGRLLFKEYAVAQQTFEEANDVLGFDLMNLCFKGSRRELSQITNMQLAIFTCSIATFRVFMQEIGVKPVIAAGHSLGEYSALTCAGALDFAAALQIVRLRGVFLQECIDQGIGHMTIVNQLDSVAVEAECRKSLQPAGSVAISCYNSPRQTAISGLTDAMTEVENRLVDLGGQITPLLDSAPFHSLFMEPAARQLERELAKYAFNQWHWPVLSNVTALPHENPAQLVPNLVRQIASPVQWTRTLEFVKNINAEIVVEIGTKAYLANLAPDVIPEVPIFAFGQMDDRKKMLERIRNGGGWI